MALVHLLVALTLLQLIYFALLVGKARDTYGVQAPATSGHEIFERYYRVQMNTLELLMVLLPSTWLAAQYLAPGWVALLCAIYLIGRFIYLRAYVADPGKRSLGFTLSFVPALILLLAGLIGSTLSLING